MAKGKKGGKKAKKNASNVFSMFEPSQIQEFKEAFGMIDANRDGFIDKEDLIATYESLGVTNVESSRLDEMIKVNLTDDSSPESGGRTYLDYWCLLYKLF